MGGSSSIKFHLHDKIDPEGRSEINPQGTRKESEWKPIISNFWPERLRPCPVFDLFDGRQLEKTRSQ